MEVETVTSLFQRFVPYKSALSSIDLVSPASLTFTAFIVFLWICRVALLKSLVALSRSNYAESLRITKRPVITDNQIQRESIWIYGYFYDTIAFLLIYQLGGLNSLPVFTLWSLVYQLFFHATVVEFVYYWFHRLLHVQWFYKNFHSYHHKSINTEPTTGVSFEIYERVSYTLLFAVAPILTDLSGQQSYLGLYLYMIWFDFMNEGGHINFEMFPDWYLTSPLRHIFYTPTYHSVHHTKFKKNYSLFMPWTDVLFGTAVYKDLEELPNRMPKAPVDFVLLVHPAGVSSTLYSQRLYPCLGQTNKYEKKLWYHLLYPYLFLVSSIFWNIGKPYHQEEEFPFVAPDSSMIDGNKKRVNQTGSTWIILNYAAMYLMPSFKKSIQSRIERAVLDAAKNKIRVVGLGNFNKAEWINHGGSDIIKNIGDQLSGTYVAHGDTLSAASVYKFTMQLREQQYWHNSVFITGSTSKIGRAVVLKLASQGIRVVMLTQCKERFDEIAAEAGVNAHNLVFTEKLSDGKDCDLWLTGKMLPAGRELLNAIPKNATVVNFAVPDPLTPALLKQRPDLLHLDTGLLAYDDKVMSPHFTWLLPDGMIYACLAGAIVHSSLGIEGHEVGPVVVDDMDKYWNAAMGLGFSIPKPTSFYHPIKMPAPKNI